MANNYRQRSAADTVNLPVGVIDDHRRNGGANFIYQFGKINFGIQISGQHLPDK
jgi:hypothetical protein